MMKNSIVRIFYIVLLILFACDSESTDTIEETALFPANSLALLAENTEIEIDNVIACAAGDPNDADSVIAFVYPRPGVTDIRFFETENAEVDKNDFSLYQQIEVPEEDFFRGYLKMFKRSTDQEKWIIITFFDDGVLNISNPIRLKHKTLPTEYTDAVEIDGTDPSMPIFSWEDGIIKENAIFFEVISEANDELLSGTYTFERHFQYYILDNVVLNITEEEPPILQANTPYNFTLMGVSEDNWVNLFIQRGFIN